VKVVWPDPPTDPSSANPKGEVEVEVAAVVVLVALVVVVLDSFGRLEVCIAQGWPVCRGHSGCAGKSCSGPRGLDDVRWRRNF